MYIGVHQAPFRNQGGFHMIGSGRGKIESQQDLQKAATVVEELDLHGLVICGGDDSNTNAAVLAEYFKSKGRRIASWHDSDIQPHDLVHQQMQTYSLPYGPTLTKHALQASTPASLECLRQLMATSKMTKLPRPLGLIQLARCHFCATLLKVVVLHANSLALKCLGALLTCSDGHM
jgi:6-phosphofructokinase